MKNKVRCVEISDKEVFIDVNDLIIELMIKANQAVSETERKVYTDLVETLSNARNNAHKTGSKITPQEV